MTQQSNHEETGMVMLVGQTQVFSERFQKRTVELEIGDNPEYPQRCEFVFTQDRVSLLNDIHEGDVVKVEFNLRGREWIPPDGRPRRVFNELNGWKISPVQRATPVEHGQVFQTVKGGIAVEVDAPKEITTVSGPPVEAPVEEKVKEDGLPF
jgi:single-strand DNA-binding protein